MATDTEWAYIAGIIEGEGWIGKCGAMTVQMTDGDVVRKLHVMSGIGTYVEGKKPKSGNRKTVHEWGVYGRNEFLVLAEAIRPWMGKRRLERLDAAVATATAKVPRCKFENQNRMRNSDGSRYIKAGGPQTVEEQRERWRARKRAQVAADPERFREYDRKWREKRRLQRASSQPQL